MAAANYYELLGVARHATAAEIEAAFKRLARKYHPKLNPGDPAAVRVFKRLCTAFRVLKHPETRRQYDQRLGLPAAHAQPDAPSAFRPPSSHSPVQHEPQPATAVAEPRADTARPLQPPSRRSPAQREPRQAPAPMSERHRAASLRLRWAIELAKRILWWSISGVVHGIVIWILARWNYSSFARERVIPPLTVGVREEFEVPPLEIRHELEPEPLPEEPETDEPPPDNPVVDHQALAEAQRDGRPDVFRVHVPGYGPYSSRSGAGRARAVASGGATQGSENAVRLGLQWLKEKQLPNGSWRVDRDALRYADLGVSALATLAFLGAGHTHFRGHFKGTVAKAIAYLKSKQDLEGCICFVGAKGERPRQMYLHAISTFALTEAYAMTKDPLLRECTQRAVDLLVRTQNDTGGWRYYTTSTDGDSSVTGWVVIALRSAKVAGFEVPDRVFDGMRKFFASVTYLRPWTEDGKKVPFFGATSYLKGMPPSSPALIAVGLLCNQYLGLDRDDPYIQRASAIMLRQFAPKWVDSNDIVTIDNLPRTQPGTNSYYYWYYANLALFQRQDEAWEQWHPQVRELLVKTQVRKGRGLVGSWPPKSKWSLTGGRVYATALAILTLEVYYRYAPIYRHVVDKLLAAYGQALTAYNEFAGRVRRNAPDTVEAGQAAVKKLEDFLRLSAPKPAKPIDKPTHKRRGEATQLLIKIQRHAKRYGEAIALLESLPKQFPGLLEEAARLRSLADCSYAQARALTEAGQPAKAAAPEAKALDIYYTLVAAQPNADLKLELWLAERLFQRRDWPRAVELYKQRARWLDARKLDKEIPIRANTHRRIIACYTNLRRYKTAGLWLERLEGLLGPTLTTRRELAYLEFRRGNHTKARRIYESIIASVKQWSPDFWQAWYDTLAMMYREGRLEQVARRIDTLEARRPGLGGAQFRSKLLDLRRLARRGS